LGSAWSKGVAFFSGEGVNHAIILIGVGVLAPLVLQYVLVGGAAGMMNPAMLGQAGLQSMATLGGAFALVMLVSYTLQLGSYFGSWRLGLGEGENLAGAIVYGLVAGLIVIGLFIAVGIIAALLAAALGAVGVLLILLAIIPIFAFLYTVWAAMVAVGLAFALLLMLAFGASLGQMNASLEMLGGGAIVILLLFGLVALLFWLTARFSCATAIMADRKTFNPLAALGESWRLTAAAQWRIIGYLTLLSVVLFVVFFVVMMIVGLSMMGSVQAGNVPEMGVGTAIAGLVLGIPAAYLTVLVPAGIYRELAAADVSSARVFA
jgi:hypothetical protein